MVNSKDFNDRIESWQALHRLHGSQIVFRNWKKKEERKRGSYDMFSTTSSPFKQMDIFYKIQSAGGNQVFIQHQFWQEIPRGNRWIHCRSIFFYQHIYHRHLVDNTLPWAVLQKDKTVILFSNFTDITTIDDKWVYLFPTILFWFCGLLINMANQIAVEALAVVLHVTMSLSSFTEIKTLKSG